DVALDRSRLLDVDFLGRVQVARHLTEDDDRLGADLRLDAAVRADREHVVTQLDLAVDAPFDREILAAAQLTVDDDALPNARQFLVHRSCLLLLLSLFDYSSRRQCVGRSLRRMGRSLRRASRDARRLGRLLTLLP